MFTVEFFERGWRRRLNRFTPSLFKTAQRSRLQCHMLAKAPPLSVSGNPYSAGSAAMILWMAHGTTSSRK